MDVSGNPNQYINQGKINQHINQSLDLLNHAYLEKKLSEKSYNSIYDVIEDLAADLEGLGTMFPKRDMEDISDDVTDTCDAIHQIGWDDGDFKAVQPVNKELRKIGSYFYAMGQR